LAFLLKEHQKTVRKGGLDSALYSAAKEGQIEACKLLARNGATVTTAKFALVSAIVEKHEAVVRWLLAEGVDVNTVGTAQLPWSEEEKRILKRRGVQSAFKSLRLTPLGAAVSTGQEEWVNRLLKLGAKIDHPGTENREVSMSPKTLSRRGAFVFWRVMS
jgi:hypothetical protein